MQMRSSMMLGMIVAAAAWSGVASAQTATVDSTPYIQARDMVSNGEVEKGHRVVDSLLKAAAPGSPAYAEGLYWRAAISQNARDAERDYRQVVVDYPLSPRVPDALLRLGQLEAARGDRDAALQHFQRIVLEYPDSPRRAEASYWVANTYLSHNDLQRGCTANADALARVASTNVELKNRIDYQQLRCRNVQLAKGAVPAVPAAAPVQSAPAPAVASAPARTTSNTREVPVTESRSATDTPVVAAKPESTATAPAVSPEAAPAPAVAPAVARSDDSVSAPAESVAMKTKTTTRTTSAAHTTVVKTSKAANEVKATSAAESKTITSTPKSTTAPTSSSRGFAVQVAAYKSRVQADSLAAKLRARGYASHVDGDTTPYRVRIGHYHTRADAVAELKRLKAKKIDGFVTEP